MRESSVEVRYEPNSVFEFDDIIVSSIVLARIEPCDRPALKTTQYSVWVCFWLKT
jgi:hypothetical protein